MEAGIDEALEVRIGRLLRMRGQKLATAESCTGGLVGHRITNVAGSSEYFLGGVIAYANQVKMDQLGVSWDTLNTHGAVSRETVLEMAAGARRTLGADIAVSVSGIAGPGGGTDEKPIGMTWIGLSAREGDWARLFYFQGNREENKERASEAALQLLSDYLTGESQLDRRGP